LLALEGAIQGIKKIGLSKERKAELKDFYNKHKIEIEKAKDIIAASIYAKSY
jgi:hypothetical protein